MKGLLALVVAGALLPGPTLSLGQTVGKRPYELEWANRTEDHSAPLVDFEDLSGWRAECKDAIATFEQTREQQIWDGHVGKLTYRGTGGAPEVRILPPNPLPVSNAFDALTLWCYGNNWGWTSDPSTPRVSVSAIFDDAGGNEMQVLLYNVDWKEWYLLHKRLTPEQIQRVKSGAQFKGLLVTGGKNTEDRILYFDNLCAF